MQQLFKPRPFDLDQRFKPTEIWLVRCLRWAADFHPVASTSPIELASSVRTHRTGQLRPSITYERDPNMKYQKDERTLKDPVCGMLVSRLTAVEDADYDQKTYYFCAPECRDAFVANPEKYLNGHRQHGVPPKKSMP